MARYAYCIEAFWFESGGEKMEGRKAVEPKKSIGLDRNLKTGVGAGGLPIGLPLTMKKKSLMAWSKGTLSLFDECDSFKVKSVRK
jgi:hypothetical protein